MKKKKKKTNSLSCQDETLIKILKTKQLMDESRKQSIDSSTIKKNKHVISDCSIRGAVRMN